MKPWEEYKEVKEKAKSKVGIGTSMARGALQGATLGFSEEAGAAAYAPLEKLITKLVAPSKEQAKYLKGYKEPSLTEIYRKTRDEERAKNIAARKAHPMAYTASEIAGGIAVPLPGGKAKSLTKLSTLSKILRSGKTGLKVGAVAGLGYGTGDITKGEVGKVALETGTGAALGGGVGLIAGGAIEGAKGVRGIFQKQKQIAKKIIDAASEDAASIVKNDIPTDLIRKSIKTKTPLIDLGGNQIRDLSQQAKLANPKARNILVQHGEQALEKQAKQLTKIANKQLSSKSKLQNLDEILLKYREESAPLYKEAFMAGDLGQADDRIVELSKDKLIAKYTKSARGSAIGRELKNLPDTDIRVLDAAKQKLDDAIGSARRSGEMNEARALQGLKSELVDTMDDIVPIYKKARVSAGERFKLEEAQNMAAKIVKGETPEGIAKIMPKLSPPEKEAFIIGIRDNIMKDIGKYAKTGRTNIAERIFGKSEDYIVRQNLKASLGADDYAKLMEAVDPVVQAGYNASQLLGGSQTAEKLTLKIPSSLTTVINEKLGKTVAKMGSKKYIKIGKMLTDPIYLEKEVSKFKVPGKGYKIPESVNYLRKFRDIKIGR